MSRYEIGTKDFEVKDIKFESFCELRECIKKDDNLKHAATLYYNGSDIVGDVGINFARYGKSKDKDTILELAGIILKHFS